MELAREAAGTCVSPRLQMTAWLLAGDLDELERHAHGNHEAALFCALAGVGNEQALAAALSSVGFFGYAALVYERAQLDSEAAAAWTSFYDRAAAAGERYLREIARLRAARARARLSDVRGSDPEVDGAARALEVLGDSYCRSGREHRAYDCYAAAAAGLDRNYVRLPTIHDKLRKLVGDCLIPAFVCQFEAELVDAELAARHGARAQLLAKRALAYSETWQPQWVSYFRRAAGGERLELADDRRGLSLRDHVDRTVEADVLEFEARDDPALLFGWVLVDRRYDERDRRLAGALRLRLHTHEGDWADDEVVKVVEACARMSASVAQVVVEGYLEHPSPRVRIAVARAAPRDSRRALEWLRKLGGDASRDVREAVAQALSEHRSAASIAGQIALWETARSGAVGDGAIRALADIRRYGAPDLGVPKGEAFDQLVLSRATPEPQQLERLLAQVRQY